MVSVPTCGVLFGTHPKVSDFTGVSKLTSIVFGQCSPEFQPAPVIAPLHDGAEDESDVQMDNLAMMFIFEKFCLLLIPFSAYRVRKFSMTKFSKQ